MTLQQLAPAPARTPLKEQYWKDERWIAEPKLDGIRFLCHILPEGIHFTSRRISDVTGKFVEKTANVPHLVKAFSQLELEYRPCILDGEICSPVGISKSYDVVSIMGSLPARALKLQQEQGQVIYHVFDLLFYADQDLRHMSLMDRRMELKVHIFSWLRSPHVRLVPQIKKYKKGYYLNEITRGKEGVILKDLYAPYGEHWAKATPTRYYDVVVMGYEPAKEMTKKVSGEVSVSKFHQRGWVGAIRFGQYKGGVLTYCGSCSGMDDNVREEVSLHQKDFLGQAMEVSAKERHPSGMFRHPQFERWRPDKNIEQCQWEVDHGD